jgi:hypothetical protein
MKQGLAVLISIFLLAACGGSRRPVEPVVNASTGTTANWEGAQATSVRYVFRADHFTKLYDFITPKQTATSCIGDAVHAFFTSGEDYSGNPSPFPSKTTADDFAPTYAPAFIRNVSVDMTSTYYAETEPGTLQSDACSYRGVANASLPSPCADFDPIGGTSVLPTPTAPPPLISPTPTPNPTPEPLVTPTATPYFAGVGFYRVRDEFCVRQGPVISPSEEETKARVGGVNIDLDRNQLGASEDLLMVLTYHSLDQNASWPFTSVPILHYAHDKTILEIHLITTGLGLDLLLGAKQPRPWSDHGNSEMPVQISRLARFEDPFGSLRSESVVIPLSQNALVDRIRIERVRGSFHLYQVDLYRLGNRE